MILRRQGNYEEARGMLQQVLAIRQRVQGSEHPHSLAAMGELGTVLGQLQEYDQSAVVLDALLQVRLRRLGTDHPETLSVMHDLAIAWHGLGQIGKAVDMQRQILAISQRVRPVDDPYTLAAMQELARSLLQSGQLDEALATAQQTYEASHRVLPECHPFALGADDALADCLEKLDRVSEARVIRKRALDRAEHDGTLDPNLVVELLSGLAWNLLRSEDSVDLEQGLSLAKKGMYLASRDRDALHLLGAAFAMTARFDDALQTFQRARQEGYEGELLPPSMLERLRNNHAADPDWQPLADFLRQPADPIVVRQVAPVVLPNSSKN